MWFWTLQLSCALLLLVVAQSCNQAQEIPEDYKVFRYNEHANITSLDPAQAKDKRNIWAVNQLYNGLVQLDDSLNVQPDIAEWWTVDSTGTVYTFRLRDDVYFHDDPAFAKAYKQLQDKSRRLPSSLLPALDSLVIRDMSKIIRRETGLSRDATNTITKVEQDSTFKDKAYVNTSLDLSTAFAKAEELQSQGKYALPYSQPLVQLDSMLHATRRAVALDFVYSLSRLTDEATASPGSWIMKDVSSIVATGQHELRITLTRPFPAFLGLLSMKFASVIPWEAVEVYGPEFRTNPVGTGPFRLKRWEENLKLVMHRNPHYHEVNATGARLPYLDGVAITFLLDKQSEFLQFAQGNIHLVSGIDASYKDELLTRNGVLQPKYEATTNMLRSPYLNTEYLGIYHDKQAGILKDKRIREAINLGFDREAMIRYLRNGIGVAATAGFVPSGLPGYQVEGYVYDPDRAKQLVQSYQQEHPHVPLVVNVATNSNYLDLVEYIQRELERIGLQVQIDVMPPSSLRQERSKGTLPVFRASWIADYPDAQNYLSLFYTGNFSPNGPNYSHYSNPTFDLLYEQALIETDVQKRIKLYTTMNQMLVVDAATVPLFYDEVLRFVSKDVSGLGINPINLLQLKEVRVL